MTNQLNAGGSERGESLRDKSTPIPKDTQTPENGAGLVEKNQGDAHVKLRGPLVMTPGEKLEQLHAKKIYTQGPGDMVSGWNTGAHKDGNVKLDDTYWFIDVDFRICRYGVEDSRTNLYSFAYLPRFSKVGYYTQESWRRLSEAYEVEGDPKNSPYMKVFDVAITIPKNWEAYAIPKAGKTKKGKIVLSATPFPK